MSNTSLHRYSTARTMAEEELGRFRNVGRLRNHWARAGKGRAYYWYLTFETSGAMHSLVARCREGLSFPYYDFTPLNLLHMTLDRIGPDEQVPLKQLSAIEVAARDTCRNVSPFELTIGALGGTPGAVGLRAFPVEPIRHLRDTLRAATLSVHPNASGRASDLRPHVSIAYCNSDVPAVQAIAAVERLSMLNPVSVSVNDVVLVLLEREQRAYRWTQVARVPLLGATPRSDSSFESP